MAGKRIFFLIADTGAGHRSAARAIAGAVEQLSQGRDSSVIVDVLRSCGRFPLRSLDTLYSTAVRRSPLLYGGVFAITNGPRRFNAMQRVTTPGISARLGALILREKPDLICSIHPLLNHVTIRTLQRLNLTIPFVTVVTDLVSVHHSWVAPTISAVVVPTTEARDFCLARGLAPERVHLLGMPIDLKFAQPEPDRAEERRQLGLAPDCFTLLLMGGGDGSGRMYANAKVLAHAGLPIQTIVVTGRNQRLLARLRSESPRWPTRVVSLGFVDTVPALMTAADVVVTKAGPGTIHEALARRRPVLLTGWIPGQEEGNVSFVVQGGVGRLAVTPDKLVAEVERLLRASHVDRAIAEERLSRLSHPNASGEIAQLLLDRATPLERIEAPSVSRQHRRIHLRRPTLRRRAHIV